MAEALRRENRVYTYQDYLSWPDEERWEIIEGEAYSMAPGASESHQRVSGELFTEFSNYLRGKKCRVYAAPFDVILPEEGETFDSATNIVQPDIMVICDKDKITPGGCHGAPDLAIEILSPSTAAKDMKKKRLLYERSGVKEYWIVDPLYKTVQVYKPGAAGKYEIPEVYSSEDKVKAGIFTDLEIDLKIVFA